MVLVLLAVGLVVPSTAFAQEVSAEDRFAPRLPDRSDPLSLVFVRPDNRPPTGSDVDIVRFGQAGRTARPNALSLPADVTGLELKAWDWIKPRGASVAMVHVEPYREWVRLEDGMHGVIISDTHLEVFHGAVEWRASRRGAADHHISMASFSVSGEGHARIVRDGRSVRIEVRAGRFDVEVNGELSVVLAGGQEREFTLPGGPERESATLASLERLHNRLNDVQERLVEGRPLTGDVLASLWEAVVEFGPYYAVAEANRSAWFPHPDVVMRDIGEALRILAAYGFSPPPTAGM